VVQHSRSAYLCFQCRFGWSPGDPIVMFTAEELERLTAYRDAIRAGLYTDLW
jgi:hypothetical protein